MMSYSGKLVSIISQSCSNPFGYLSHEPVMSDSPTRMRMLKACEAGDLPGLQHLFEILHIRPGTRVLWRPSDQPATYEMVTTAIANSHSLIVSYILSIYSTGDISCAPIVQGIIDHPNLEIMDLVYRHSPDIINFEFDPLRTFLTEACRGPQLPTSPLPNDQSIALVQYLLHHGAAPNEGSLGGCGALLPAIEAEWVPIEVMEQMLVQGAIVGLLVFGAAIEKRRADVLELFFEKARFSRDLNREKMLEKAGSNGEIISVVESGMKQLELRNAQTNSRNRHNWWQWWKQSYNGN